MTLAFWIRRGVLCLGCMGVLLALPAHALDPAKALTQYRLTQWGTDDGLAHSSVHLLQQDPAGFMWVGTLVGLARFDGVRFLNAGSTDGQRVDYFTRSVVFSATGDWMVMGEAGLARRLDHRWQVHPLAGGVVARSIAPRRAGGYWIGSDRGVLRFQPPAGQPAEALAAEPAGFGPSVSVWYLREDDDGRLWMCTDRGTYLREPDGRVRHLEQEFGLPQVVVWMVHRDAQGVHWIGGRNGLIRFDGVSHRRYTPADGLALATVRWIAEDRHGSLWIATPGGGVQRFRNGKFETLRSQDGLRSDSVMTLHVDASDNVWLGMAGGGVARLSDSPIQVLRQRDGLTGDWIWTIHQDAQGDTWIGTNGNGLTVLRGQRAVRRILGGVQGLDTVWAMHAWDQGRAIVSSGKGVGRVERDDSITWLSLSSAGDVPPRIFLRLSDGRLLLARRSRIVEVREDGVFPSAFPDVGNAITSMIQAPDGELVVATSNGRILAIDRQYRQRPLLAAIGVPITSMKRDPQGRIWAGANGLLIVDGARSVRVSAANGFPDRVANDVVLGLGGVLWVSTNRGVVRSTQQALLHCLDDSACRPPLTVLDERDGLVTAETNGGAQPSGWLEPDGHLWLPSINGAIRIDADFGAHAPALPAVVIDALRADRQTLDAQSPVPALTRDLEIDYTVPEMTLPRQLRFRYRLLPEQSEWVEVGSRRTAFFASLKPGTYRFEVAAARQHETWSDMPTVRVFDVQAAWYQRGWVRAASASLALLMLSSALWWRIHGLQLRRQALEREVHARTAELAQANLELDRMARTDVLTGIANRRAFASHAADLCTQIHSGRFGDAVLVVMIADIDDFKAYNDHYGHLQGDACLRAVAQAFDTCIRSAGGMACRYGGEEFAAVLVLPDEDQAQVLAEQLVAAVRALGLPHAHARAASHVTLSLGLCLAHARKDNVDALLHDADQALYQAKKAGRNRWARWAA